MNTNSINKQVADSSIIKLFALAFTFVYSILMVRLLGVEGNGAFSFIWASGNVSLLILGLNAGSGLRYFVAKSDFSRNKILTLSTSIYALASICLAGITTILYVTGSDALSFFLPEGFQSSFFFTFFLMGYMVQALFHFFVSFAIGHFFYKTLNQYIFWTAAVKLLALGGFYIATHLSLYTPRIEQVLGAYIGIEVVFAIAFVWHIIRKAPFRFDFDLPFQKFVKPFLSYLTKSWLISVLNFSSRRIFNWVVVFYHGLNPLGILALSFSLLGNLEQLFVPFGNVLSPYLVKMPVEEGKKKFLYFLRLSNTAALLATMTVLATSHIFIPLLFGRAFEEAVITTNILFLCMPFVNLKNIGNIYAASQNKHHYMLYADIITFIFAITTNLLVIPTFGIVGASWVLLATYGLAAMLTTYFLRQKMGLTVYRHLVVTKDDVAGLWKWILKKRV